MTQDRNISTEHQRPGDAKRPSDTLDRGQRPFIAGNGEVHGSGAGAGGGNPGEDYDDDAVAGGGGLTEDARVNDGQEDQIHQSVENQSSVKPEDYPDR